MGNKVQVCIIGAGPSVIAAAKNAIQYGFDVVVFEKNEIDHPHFTFTGGTRHSTEVDYHAFRKDLGHELKKACIDIGKPPQGNKSRYKSAL